MPDRDRLAELLVRWEDARAAGQPVTPGTLCADAPGDLPELLRSIELLGRIGPTLDLAAPTAPPDEPPRAAGLEIVGPLGEGGMGVVFRARQPALGRDVALKVMRRDAVDANGVDRFTREARALARLRHEGIVPLYDANLSDGRPYLVMELVEGGSLADRLKEYTRDHAAAARLVARVARAVQYAHEQGVLHRDLKPANVLIDAQGRPLVSDFGLAKLLGVPDHAGAAPEAAAGSVTASGLVVGTPDYMAPEQFESRLGPVAAAADVWCLGLILHEALVGRRPTQRPAGRVAIDGELPRPRRACPRLDPALEAVCLRCLRTNPADRYPSAAAVADDLDRWLAGRLPRAYVGRLRRSWYRARRRRLTVAAVALAALAAVLAQPGVRHGLEGRAVTWSAAGALDRGETVELVPRGSTEFWHRWARGNGDRIESDGQTCARFRAVRPSLIELLPDTGRASYRVTARIRQVNPQSKSAMGVVNDATAVGVFVALRSFPHEYGERHAFAVAWFDELGPNARVHADKNGPGACALQTRFGVIGNHPATPDRSFFDSANWVHFRPEGADRYTGEWHELTVEVRPNQIRSGWGGKWSVYDVPTRLPKHWRQTVEDPQTLGGLPAEPPADVTRGSVGIYACSCGVDIARFTLKPLPD